MVKAAGRPKISSSSSNKCHEFFKVYLPHHNSHKMTIPPAFVKHLKGGLPCKSVLTSTTNKSWSVSMKKEDDDVILDNGWDVFVQDNDLGFGDFLVFQYDGTSKFNVKVYDKNGCEKERAVREMEHTLFGGKEKSYESADGGEANRVEPAKFDVVQIDDVMGVEIGKSSEEGRRRTRGSRAGQGRGRGVTDTRNSKKLRPKESVVKQLTKRSSRLRAPSETQQNGAVEAANKFLSKHLHFKVVMHAAYVTGNLNIPLNFANQHMKHKVGSQQKVTLWVSGRSWPVTMNSYYSLNQGKHCSSKFSRGWQTFARENSLRKGDVCVFELIKVEPHLMLDVSIIRGHE